MGQVLCCPGAWRVSSQGCRIQGPGSHRDHHTSVGPVPQGAEEGAGTSGAIQATAWGTRAGSKSLRSQKTRIWTPEEELRANRSEPMRHRRESTDFAAGFLSQLHHVLPR